jgi:uncharacterized protein YbjT (DUF2867 family)
MSGTETYLAVAATCGYRAAALPFSSHSMSPLTQITVFGASGFVGRHTLQRLAKTGATIRVPTRNPEKAMRLRPMGDVGQIVPIPCSVRNDAAVASAIGSSDVVINLIGILYEKRRDTFQSVHVEVAARIARLAKEQGAQRLIHMSALGADANALSAYARSKAAGEQAVTTFYPGAILMRPSIIFGAEDNFFNRFASLARFSPILPLIGGGHSKFQPVYVGDVADAICKAVDQHDGVAQIVELGGPQIYSFRQLMELILAETGRRRYLMSVPWPLAMLEAFFLEKMPNPLLTRDQVVSLRTDNILHNDTMATLRTFGIDPTPLKIILPTYMDRYRGAGEKGMNVQWAGFTY